MAIQFFDAATDSPSGCAAGVFIPRSALDGVTAGEFGSGVATNIKTSKAVAGIVNTCDRKIKLVDNYLTINPTQTTPTSQTSGTIQIPYTITVDLLLNLETSALQPVPVPTSGANSGNGDFSVAEIFTGAAVVNADAAITAEGIVIPFADTAPFGAPSTLSNISVGQDNRLWFAGLFRYLVYNVPVRSANTQSAITATAKNNLTRKAIPTEWTATTDPQTALTAAILQKREVVSIPLALTIEYLINQQTQTFEVNVA